MTAPASRRILLVLLGAAAVAHAALVLRTAARETAAVRRTASLDVVPGSVRVDAARVRSAVPRDAGILYVGPPDEPWWCRIWQRALYPRRVVLVPSTTAPGAVFLRAWKRRHGVRYALVAGPLPPEWRLLPVATLAPLPDGTPLLLAELEP